MLGLVRSLPDGKVKLDKDGAPYAILGFGTGEHRVQGSRASQAGLTDAIVSADLLNGVLAASPTLATVFPSKIGRAHV